MRSFVFWTQGRGGGFICSSRAGSCQLSLLSSDSTSTVIEEMACSISKTSSSNHFLVNTELLFFTMGCLNIDRCTLQQQHHRKFPVSSRKKSTSQKQKSIVFSYCFLLFPQIPRVNNSSFRSLTCMCPYVTCLGGQLSTRRIVQGERHSITANHDSRKTFTLFNTDVCLFEKA